MPGGELVAICLSLSFRQAVSIGIQARSAIPIVLEGQLYTPKNICGNPGADYALVGEQELRNFGADRGQNEEAKK